MDVGDLDVWTFTATAGDRIGIHVSQLVDNDDLRPWLRLWAPNGAVLGDTSGVSVAELNGAIAPVTGTYLVLVASYDSFFDGTGTYRLTLARTLRGYHISPGEDGGPLVNGSTHSGTMGVGDLDVWTFTANAGERIGIHASQLVDNDDLRPWLRLWAPNGAVLGDTSGVSVAEINGAIAPVTGTYLVLVSSFDSFFDGTGTYELTMTHTPGPVTITAGDEGGALANGVPTTGVMTAGDLDVYTIDVVAGRKISLNLLELTDTADFRPWIRLWAPNGSSLADTSALSNAIVNNAVAPVSGTYLILVSSFDSFFDGTGTYQLTVTHTP